MTKDSKILFLIFLVLGSSRAEPEFYKRRGSDKQKYQWEVLRTLLPISFFFAWLLHKIKIFSTTKTRITNHGPILLFFTILGLSWVRVARTLIMALVQHRFTNMHCTSAIWVVFKSKLIKNSSLKSFNMLTFVSTCCIH